MPVRRFQILKYMINIWLREMEGGTATDRLPPIIPLVFYHGQGRWTAARSVTEMIEAPAEFAPFPAGVRLRAARFSGRSQPLRAVADTRSAGGPCWR